MNAHSLIFSSLLPNLTSVRAVQSSNEYSSTILAKGKLMLLKDWQPLNAPLIISSLPHSTSVRALQSMNAYLSANLTPGMITLLKL